MWLSSNQPEKDTQHFKNRDHQNCMKTFPILWTETAYIGKDVAESGTSHPEQGHNTACLACARGTDSTISYSIRCQGTAKAAMWVWVCNASMDAAWSKQGSLLPTCRSSQEPVDPLPLLNSPLSGQGIRYISWGRISGQPYFLRNVKQRHFAERLPLKPFRLHCLSCPSAAGSQRSHFQGGFMALLIIML